MKGRVYNSARPVEKIEEKIVAAVFLWNKQKE